MPYRIGLTGSIGMGKSTAAKIFAEAEDVVVWDADAAVHRLYAPGGSAVAPIATIHPEAIGPTGVDRSVLKEWIRRDPKALKRIEGIVHPLVAADRAAFLEQTSAAIALLDIPLLFETGGDKDMDLTVTVSTDPETQRARVLERPGMTAAQLDHILSLQLPDAEKSARADRVIDSSTLESARADIAAILRDVRRQIDA